MAMVYKFLATIRYDAEQKEVAELSYNVQLFVSKNQIIVANDICQDKHDAHQFVPQIKNVKENIELTDETKVGVDSGYSDADNIKCLTAKNKV